MEQLHAEIILALKNKWPCSQHQGEHGEPGHCYVDANGGHVGLNHRRLKIWAAAVVSNPTISWDLNIRVDSAIGFT